jgi:hypothetical protein
MSVTFHVFANEEFVTSVSNRVDNKDIRRYIDSLWSSSTPHYGLRVSNTSPHYDGWYLMRESLPELPAENVPPVIRTLALMMDL